MIKSASDKIIPGVVQTCPIHGLWGKVNFIGVNTIMNGMPIQAFPSRAVRLTMRRAYTKSNEFIGQMKGTGEVYALSV